MGEQVVSNEEYVLLIKSMDKREELKTENSMANSTFSDEIPSSFPLSSIFDMPCMESTDHHHHQKGLSLGYMDLLGIQDFDSPSLFDLFPAPMMPPAQSQPPQPQLQQQQTLVPSPASTVPAESSEVVNTPATPNSSSISSSSNEAANEERTKAGGEEEEDQDHEKTKKQ